MKALLEKTEKAIKKVNEFRTYILGNNHLGLRSILA